MRAQIVLPKGTEGHRSRAQGTDRAQIEKSICALRSLCFSLFIYLKGTKAQINNKPQDIYKKGKYRQNGRKTALQMKYQQYGFYLCPVPSTAFRGAVA